MFEKSARRSRAEQTLFEVEGRWAKVGRHTFKVI
jgi:hypothetical protein